MTKNELAKKIQSKLGVSKNESTELLEGIISVIKSTLENGEKIKIHGFGNFEVKQKRDRKGRNPMTGETMILEARRVLTFKPSVMLRQAVNK